MKRYRDLKIWVCDKNSVPFSHFGRAVWQAMANIQINKYICIYTAFRAQLLLAQYKTKTKKFAEISDIFSMNFQNFTKLRKCRRHLFEILRNHKPSLGSYEVPHKILARLVPPCWGLLDTNRQAKYIHSRL